MDCVNCNGFISFNSEKINVMQKTSVLTKGYMINDIKLQTFIIVNCSLLIVKIFCMVKVDSKVC